MQLLKNWHQSCIEENNKPSEIPKELVKVEKAILMKFYTRERTELKTSKKHHYKRTSVMSSDKNIKCNNSDKGKNGILLLLKSQL